MASSRCRSSRGSTLQAGRRAQAILMECTSTEPRKTNASTVGWPMTQSSDRVDVYVLPDGMEMACYSCSELARAIQNKMLADKGRIHVCRACSVLLREATEPDQKELN